MHDINLNLQFLCQHVNKISDNIIASADSLSNTGGSQNATFDYWNGVDILISTQSFPMCSMLIKNHSNQNNIIVFKNLFSSDHSSEIVFIQHCCFQDLFSSDHSNVINIAKASSYSRKHLTKKSITSLSCRKIK